MKIVYRDSDSNPLHPTQIQLPDPVRVDFTIMMMKVAFPLEESRHSWLTLLINSFHSRQHRYLWEKYKLMRNVPKFHRTDWSQENILVLFYLRDSCLLREADCICRGVQLLSSILGSNYRSVPRLSLLRPSLFSHKHTTASSVSVCDVSSSQRPKFIPPFVWRGN